MYPSNITDIHVELTDKCQASCPMCSRNINGGKAREFVGNHEITLDTFKQWFTPTFLSTLKHFYACGNYGDPIIAQDCLEIFEYVRQSNNSCRLGIHTNGGARTTQWWKNLAGVLGDNHIVTFGIDGFEQSHQLYRRGTVWNKIINNANSFIEAGGKAEVDCLVFKHNETEITEFENYIIKLGFKKVNFKYTKRFYDMKTYPVENVKGEVEYYLEPAEETKVVNFISLDKISKDISIWKNIVKQSFITPQCIEKNELYVDARGNVFPCCWVGTYYVEDFIEENIFLQKLRNQMVVNTRDLFSAIDIPNLNSSGIDNVKWSNFENFIHKNKPWICVKNCNGQK